MPYRAIGVKLGLNGFHFVYNSNSNSIFIVPYLHLKTHSTNTKQKKQKTITVVKSTPNQSIHSHKSSMTCLVTSETLKIPDLSKTGLTDILDMLQ